jgi:hypothetical protein
MWSYNNEPFEPNEEFLKNYVGFVYEVEDKDNGKKYIGKKKFWTKRRLPPLKGKKNRRVKIDESDWKTYCGSSEEVKQLVEENSLDRFDRRILKLCKSLGEMSYYEMKYQLEFDVLLKPNEYYNAYVGGRINRRHLGIK